MERETPWVNEQLSRFRAALRRKRLRARPTEEQPSRIEASRPPDERDVRAKSTGKGKKTADKWNQ